MDEKTAPADEQRIIELLKSRVSRAQLLRATGIGLAVAAIPTAASANVIATSGSTAGGSVAGTTFPFYPQTGGTYTTESLTEIVSNLLTVKMAQATSGAALLSAPGAAAGLGISGLVLTLAQAVIAASQYEIDWLQSIVPNATPVTTFTIDVAGQTPQNFGATAELLSLVQMGAEIAAVRELAELGQPMLAKDVAQMLAAEALGLGAFRALLAATGSKLDTPPNNKAFATDLFLYTRDAVAFLAGLGVIGGKGTSVPYPGRVAVLAAAGPMAAAVVQRTPNSVTSSGGNNFFGSVETFTVQMTGSQETGGGDPNGRGTAIITIDSVRGTISYQIQVFGITLPATADHIHQGVVGKSGPIVVPFPTAPDASGLASGTVTADPALLQAIVANPAGYYVNVHTTNYPGGAIRGQLA
jgi:hypothetical protein